jgi:cytochrome c553
MRIITWLGLAVSLAFVGFRTFASAPADDQPASPTPGRLAATLETEKGFREHVRPFLETYCLGCHGADKPKGDLDLSVYTTADSVAKDLAQWETVQEQLKSGTMPPAKAKKRPDDVMRQEIVAWIQSVRKHEATRNAGDPGRVLARRLSNAEYDNTIRDLTGADLRPTREFPVDPANEAGFDNSAESLTMSPALVKKYLEAARFVAEHVVLKPRGFAFAPFPVAADTDRDKYCVRRIIDFYKRQRTDLADYFLAAWRFEHRRVLGRPTESLADVAARDGLSAKYLGAVWSFLTQPGEEVGPVAAVRSMWRELPPPGDEGTIAAQAGCERMRDFVVELRQKVTPEVKNLSARGISSGSQPLVLWKNRQFVANRRRYVPGGMEQLCPDELTTGTPAARSLAVPTTAADRKRYAPAYARFCSIFPDAFLISERARVYLDPNEDKDNKGRLLSAGFHSMTGYFRDDAPLYDLILDAQGQRELDGLWEEFDFITGAPMRQYASFLWYERAESRFVRGPGFDFVRAEDKDAGSPDKIKRFAEAYRDKARKNRAGEIPLQAIADHFEIIAASIRRVEEGRRDAEPRHVEALQAFAERAYRRPLAPAERAGVAAFYRSLRASDGQSHEDAVRDTMISILMSPHFCYRVDLPGTGPGIRPLSDYALASRLSYFLWSSMPDDKLLAHAAAGDLRRGEVLVAEAKRMVRDDRIRGLATEFGGNWLDFRRFEEHNSVDRARFKTFNDELRRAMFEEPVRFIVDMVQNDRAIDVLIDGKHTFVNEALARHYGMPLPRFGPDGWARVDDARPYGRGGVLAMAVFLTKNSPGLRTSPVKRGYWVVRRLLGENIPAPPPNVPDLPSDEAKMGDLTLRQALARHRADKSCAGCHERFDAIGLAYEGYGPVGEFRTIDLGGKPVDVKATFPGGGEGNGVDGLRTYLDDHRRGEFIDNFCRKLLTYALGRTLLPSDDGTIETMRTKLAADGGRFGCLVESIVTSPQFLNRRVESETVEKSGP